MDIKTLKKCLPKRSILPALSMFRIDEESITATNMDVYFTQKIPTGMPKPCLVYGKQFETLHDMGIESIESMGDELKFKLKNKVTAMVEANNVSDYVALPKIDVDTAKVCIIDREKFIHGLKQVEFSCMAKNFSPVLTGINVVISGNCISFTGTNAFSLANRKGTSFRNDGTLNIILPVAHVPVILSALEKCKDETATITVNESGSYATIDCENKTIGFLLVQGSFPTRDNENIYPRQYTYAVTYEVEQLKNMVKSLAKLTWHGTGDLLVERHRDYIRTVEGSNSYIYDMQPLEDGEKGKLFLVNLRYLTKYLSIAEVATSRFVTISVVSHDKPLVFNNWTSNSVYSDLVYIVRPLLGNI